MEKFNAPVSVGNKTLMNMAVGGVGAWLVLLARILGLEVVTQVGSAETDELVSVLGVSATVNYQFESLKA